MGEGSIAATTLAAELEAAGKVGMVQAAWARIQPERVQVFEQAAGRTRTFRQVNQAANRMARLMRQAGLKAGDAVALLCSNRAEFVEVLAACQRSGMRVTPVNWRLTADEVAYIVRDCEAKALFAEARFPAAAAAARDCPDLRLKLAIGGDLDGFVSADAALPALDGSDIPDPALGSQMLYTSGTTGRPKGVDRGPVSATVTEFLARAAYDHRGHVQLCAGPAYHAAPLAFDVRAAMNHGLPLVMIDHFDAETVLQTIAEHRVTHMHLVPVMFQRLLALPAAVKARYDLSSLRFVIHGAAPCPPDVKRAIIDWFGPIVHEYYAGSEGGAGFFIGSEEWLRKPGSVGRRPTGLGVRIIDEAGRDCPPGVPGTIYHQMPPGGAFVYFKDPEKTARSRIGDHFTMGDVGYFDEDDYLFLTGRDAETIISGGVNIYPQEIDNELLKHPAVEDVCCIGAPNAEWGEEVKALVQLRPGVAPSEALKAEILAGARAHLAGFKIPKSIDFVDALPRTSSGKLQRGKAREPYWAGRATKI